MDLQNFKNSLFFVYTVTYLSQVNQRVFRFINILYNVKPKTDF